MLGSPGKHPLGALVPRGLEQATTDPTVIDAWWSAHPAANVGVRTGSRSGLVVLDVDGEAGAASLRSLVARHGRFAAVWVRTGSGGWHAYFSRPEHEVRNSTGRLGPGLDVRGDGGYVVAPPSLHASGRRYRWAPAIPRRLPPMPAWMWQPTMVGPRAGLRPVDLEREVAAYVVAAVEREAREVAIARPGRRNDRLNVAAWRLGQLVGAGLVSESSITDVLMAAADAAGLPEREARATVRSGLTAGMLHPRPTTGR
jgi:Bifunctional DNA primase/polymerase, N-terminal